VNTPEVCQSSWVRPDSMMIGGESVRVSASSSEAGP
jgi:hypothetical protein